MNPLTTWAFNVIVTLTPPSAHTAHGNESEAEVNARYHSIAEDVVHVVENSPPVFSDGLSKYTTVALILSIAKFESDFSKKVDVGSLKGDGGKSWCLVQVQLGSKNVYFGSDEMRTWSGKDLVKDRKKCFKTGLEAVRISVNSCSGYKDEDKLSMYAAGFCYAGSKESRHRWNLANKIVNWWVLLDKFKKLLSP